MANDTPKPVTTIDNAKLKLRFEVRDDLLTVTGAEVSGRLLTTTPSAKEGEPPTREHSRPEGELVLPEALKVQLARLVEAKLRADSTPSPSPPVRVRP